jgi:hypothetical protein
VQVCIRCVAIVAIVRIRCGDLRFSGSYQKWQRTDDSWKGKYARGSYKKDAASFKGKCNNCGEHGHKQGECPKAQGQKPS